MSSNLFQKTIFILTIIMMISCNATEERVRWGILGISRFAQQKMIETLQSSSRSIVAALASRDAQKAYDVAQKHAIPNIHTSYDDLLKDPNVDAIYIGLPNSMHAEWAIKCAQSKKHVLCEKPIGLTVTEVQNIEAAASVSNVTIFEAFQHLHHPQTIALQKLIASKKIGDLKLIKSSFSMTTRFDKSNIRMHKELGGGVLWDKAGYHVSLALFLTKQIPIKMHAHQLYDKDMNVNTHISGSLEFNNEFLAQFDSGLHTPYREGLEIVGTTGRLIVSDPWRPARRDISTIIYSNGNDDDIAIIDQFEVCDPYSYEIAAMESCVLDRAQPIVSLQLSKDIASVLEKLQYCLDSQ